MDFVQAIVVWGLTALAGFSLASVLAGIKNRDLSFWMSWCFLVPPLVVLLAFLPRLQGLRPRRVFLDHPH
jgi:hypothetical protein